MRVFCHTFIYIACMKEIKCATGDRRMNYKGRWTSSWYFTLPAEARNLFDYMIDQSSPAGIFDPCDLDHYNFITFKDENEYFSVKDALSILNKKRDIIRVLDDGFWLLEDFWRILHGNTVLDLTSNSGWIKGFRREYEKHNIDPKSILGIHKVIYPKESLKKG